MTTSIVVDNVSKTFRYQSHRTCGQNIPGICPRCGHSQDEAGSGDDSVIRTKNSGAQPPCAISPVSFDIFHNSIIVPD